MGCFDARTAAEIVTGELDTAVEHRTHAEQCAACSQLLREALAEATHLESSAKVTEASPARRFARPKKPVEDAPLTRATLVGRYLILEPLGEGGMGVVYSAYDPELDRKVALKLVRAHRDRSTGDEQARLLREAHAMAKLSHPNVLPIFDVGTFGERVFLAIEFVEGTTLRGWLKQQPRSWREVLDMCAAAGRGLAAAHDAGLIHRDFKPDNVLVGVDGRVRVTDFGLARAEHALEEADIRVHESRPLETPMTVLGSVVGTPAYMAPEQLEAGTADARSDQFAFCVTTYEALYGVRPFDGKGAERAEAIAAGRIREPPKRIAVPAHVRRVLLKGLASDPDQRFPSMTELLRALLVDPTAVRRRWLAGLALAGIIAAAIAVVAWTRDRSAVCRTDSKLAAIWNAKIKAAVRERFATTGSPYAADAWMNTERALDDYVLRWQAMRTEACEATRVTRDQTEAVMTLRMACLDTRMHELAALVGIFREADASVVLKAQSASTSLSKLEPCGDVAGLIGRLPAPRDRAAQREIDEVRALLARSKALRIAGKYSEALAIAAPLIERANKLGYRPLEAELLVNVARLQDYTEDMKNAKASALAAFVAAEAGGHDDAKIEAVGAIALVAAKLADKELGHQYGRLGKAILERKPNDDQRAVLLIDLGRLYSVTNESDACIAAQTEAIALLSRRDPEDKQLIPARINLARCLVNTRRYDDAVEPLESALASLKLKFPSQLHPIASAIFYNLGDIENARGNFEAAIAHFQNSAQIAEGANGRMNSESIDARGKVGSQYLEMGEYAKAIAILDEELANAEAADLAASASALLTDAAEARLRSGDLAVAEQMVQRLIALDVKLMGADSPALQSDYIILADVYAATGRRKEALAVYEKVDAMIAKLGDVAGLRCRLLTSMGSTQLALNDPRALATLEAAANAANEPFVAKYDRARARFALADLLAKRNGDLARARQLAQSARDELAKAFARGAALRAEVDAWLAHH